MLLSNKTVRETREKFIGFVQEDGTKRFNPSDNMGKFEVRRIVKQKMDCTKSERINNQLRTQHPTLNKDVKNMTRTDKTFY